MINANTNRPDAVSSSEYLISTGSSGAHTVLADRLAKIIEGDFATRQVFIVLNASHHYRLPVALTIFINGVTCTGSLYVRIQVDYSVVRAIKACRQRLQSGIFLRQFPTMGTCGTNALITFSGWHIHLTSDDWQTYIRSIIQAVPCGQHDPMLLPVAVRHRPRNTRRTHRRVDISIPIPRTSLHGGSNRVTRTNHYSMCSDRGHQGQKCCESQYRQSTSCVLH